MADTSPDHRGPSSFCTQANALLRKSLIYQKRNPWGNCRLLLIPALIFGLLYGFQKLLEQVGPNNNDNKKGCDLTDFGGPVRCAVTSPPQWPPLLLIPDPENRAVRTNSLPYTGLPDASCRKTGSCPVTVLVTGNNQSLGEVVGGKMLSCTFPRNSSNVMDGLANVVLASGKNLGEANYIDPAFVLPDSLYYIQHQCTSDSPVSIPLQQPDKKLNTDAEATCVEGLTLWRNSSSEVNQEIYQGYFRGNSNGKINEILAAYDFSNTNEHTFNVSIWYNATYLRPDIQGQGMPDIQGQGMNLLRVPRSVNLVSNAYLQFLRGPGTKLLFEFVKEMPKLESKGEQDILARMAPIFFTWVVLQLFPVILTSLVYEKQQKLRIMMKMHGLGDGPYWMISYAYFLTISLMFMFLVMFCGSGIGLIFFTMNDYTIQSVFYFIFINLQIAFAFLAAACFTNVNTATVVSYIFVFGSGLLGSYVFRSFLEKPSFPRWGILAFELYPGFSLYGGLYEFAFYSSTGYKMGTHGMRWENLTDSRNGMRQILVLMVVEWLVVLFVGYYMDQVSASGSGKSPLCFLQNSWKKNPSSSQKPHTQRQGSQVLVNMEKADVSQEREKVEQLLLEPSTTHAVICDNLRKVYPGRDGNPDKLAVRGLSLALPRAECFGMLGPNGAGKTSFISMMIGLTKPTSGTAYIQGLDLRTQMDSIHTCIGVCPQDNLLWDTLTGREHLLFYGRLKNLKGSALTRAVDESLKSLNLLNGGVADKQVRKYSGGMKRRLSAAISLIGDPKVVYMDEPSTGLDPASRKQLWNVVKSAKQDRAIILTTHSMEEAEALCDRLGIFVDGSLQCVGNSKELKARYGGSYVFTMTTPVDHEEEVVNLVRRLSPSAVKTYHTSGTQKFEMPKHEVRIADVFHAVETAKTWFQVFAWGLSDTTLEDVFIKVANSAS